MRLPTCIRFAAPQAFFPLAGKLIPWFSVASAACSRSPASTSPSSSRPTDAQQGEAYRIIFIHVPAAWMSMFLYLVMAFWAGGRPGVQHPAVVR